MKNINVFKNNVHNKLPWVVFTIVSFWGVYKLFFEYSLSDPFFLYTEYYKNYYFKVPVIVNPFKEKNIYEQLRYSRDSLNMSMNTADTSYRQFLRRKVSFVLEKGFVIEGIEEEDETILILICIKTKFYRTNPALSRKVLVFDKDSDKFLEIW